MSLERGPIQRPTRVSNERAGITVTLVGICALVMAQWIPTQIIAAQLGYPEWIGHPMFWHVYAPFEWPLWWFLWAQPVQQAFSKPLVDYGASAAQAFATLPYGVGASVVVAIGCTIASAIYERRRVGDATQLFDSGGKWAGLVEAAKLKLLGKAGMVVGALEEAGDRLLRYAGELGIEYVEPPGGGKSVFIQWNLTISLQNEAARRVAFAWWETVLAWFFGLIPWWQELARNFRAWTAYEKRADPWGEEPMIVMTDLKMEFVVGATGFQHDGLKKRVEVLAPIGVPETFTDVDGNEAPFPIRADQLACYNPFWSARLGTDQGYQNLFGKVKSIVDRMTGEAKSHWDLAALGWGAAVLEHLGFVALTTGNYEIFSPCGLMDYLSAFREVKTDEIDPKTKQKKVISAMDVLLNQMKSYQHDTTDDMAFGWIRTRSDGSTERTRTKPSIFNGADAMLAKDVRERTSVWSSFLEKLNLFRSDALRKYTTRCTFEWKALANDPKRSAMIFIATPSVFDMADLEVYTAMVVDDLLRDLTYGGTPKIRGRSVRGNKYPVILMLEEAYVAAGGLPGLEKVAGLIRGYGIRIVLILQSWAQHHKMFNPDGRSDTISETLDVHLYGAVKLASGGEHVERDLGNRSQLVVTENKQGDKYALMPFQQVSEQTQLSENALLTEKELSQIDDEHYIAIIRGHNFYLRKSQWYKNKKLERRARMAPKLSSENTVTEPFFVRSVRSAIGDAGMAQVIKKRPVIVNDEAGGGDTPAAPAGVKIESPIKAWMCAGSVARVIARDIGEAIALARDAIAVEAQRSSNKGEAA